jgi:hypothetical protein
MRLAVIGVLCALSAAGCGRLAAPTAPAAAGDASFRAVSIEAGPAAARLLGRGRLALHGAGWDNLYGVALLTEPTGGGVLSYVNTTIDAPQLLVHTNTLVQVDIDELLDLYGLPGSQTLLSFQVLDGGGNLIQERIVDPPLVLR